MSIVRKQMDELSPMSEEKAKEIESLSDEDLDYSDIPPLDKEFFKNAKRVIKFSSQDQEIESTYTTK